MSDFKKPPKNIGELVDQLDRIREELLTIQRAMEKLEPVKTLPADSSDGKKSS
jgi:hypothetical protein